MSAQSSERPEDNLQDIRRQLDVAKKELNALVMKPRESLRDFEYRVKRHSDKLLSLKVARTSSTAAARTRRPRRRGTTQKKGLLIFEEKSPFKIKGWRDVNVLFLGGNEIRIVSRFFATNKKRFERSKGFHSGLALLGISERLSSATLDLLAKNAAALGSSI